MMESGFVFFLSVFFGYIFNNNNNNNNNDNDNN